MRAVMRAGAFVNLSREDDGGVGLVSAEAVEEVGLSCAGKVQGRYREGTGKVQGRYREEVGLSVLVECRLVPLDHHAVPEVHRLSDPPLPVPIHRLPAGAPPLLQVLRGGPVAAWHAGIGRVLRVVVPRVALELD